MTGDRYFILDQNAIYFLTHTVVRWLDVFARMNHKAVVVDSLDYCIDKKGLNVHVWCLMTNHLHLIASARDGFKLSYILRDMKEHIQKKGSGVFLIRIFTSSPQARMSYFSLNDASRVSIHVQGQCYVTLSFRKPEAFPIPFSRAGNGIWICVIFKNYYNILKFNI